MKNKPHRGACSEQELERMLAPLLPSVARALSVADGPSEAVMRTIHHAAVASAVSRRHRRQFVLFGRTLAAAAALAILVGGAIQTRLEQRESRHARIVGHLLNLGAPGLADAQTEPSAELANRLLAVQGLTEEAFAVTPDEEGSLWL